MKQACPCIRYQDGYKYQLQTSARIQSGCIPGAAIHTEYIRLETNGELHLREGYAWDGASGPMPDLKCIMRGSLAHDAMYQLMREGHLDHAQFREAADRCLQRLCIEDGMWRLFAWLAYRVVRRFGNPYCDPSSQRPWIKAPGGCGP